MMTGSDRDKKLDKLYDDVDTMFRAGFFGDVDKMLDLQVVEDLSLHFMIGLLTATLPAKKSLKNRVTFKQRVKDELVRRGEYRESLLSGL